MIEMAAEGQPGHYLRGVAGDSFNTAVYLARAGLHVDYLTRLGDDGASQDIVQQMAAEDIGTDLIQRCPDRQPGLYLIDNDASGERYFSYWRDHSPAREMFDQPVELSPLPDFFYFTGITLGISRSGIDHLTAGLKAWREAGCTVIFDPNYRAQLWRDTEQAQGYYRQVLPFCDIVLPTLEDETALWEIDTVEECRAMYRQYPVRELVIKGEKLISHVFCGKEQFHKQAQAVTPLDTTGAGDAFNAGYLSVRLRDGSVEDALTAAQSLSATVVQHQGAILPRPQTKHTGSH